MSLSFTIKQVEKVYHHAVTQVITTLKSSFQIGEINTHERTGKTQILVKTWSNLSQHLRLLKLMCACVIDICV